MTTQFLNIPYDEETLNNEEIAEIEDFSALLFHQLEDKVKEMGLSMTDFTITKFTQEDLDNMPIAFKTPTGKLCIKEV